MNEPILPVMSSQVKLDKELLSDLSEIETASKSIVTEHAREQKFCNRRALATKKRLSKAWLQRLRLLKISNHNPVCE